MQTYPLTPSQLTLLRVRYGLSEDEGALLLGITLDQLRTLEEHSQQVPAGVLDVVDMLWGPPPVYRQLTIWESLAELGRLDAQAARDAGDHARHA